MDRDGVNDRQFPIHGDLHQAKRWFVMAFGNEFGIEAHSRVRLQGFKQSAKLRPRIDVVEL